ncbi:phosphotransferase family protein [Natronococcus occultus]|uniref:Putative homoserine kinase type II (Protein kinase fold) n=1 Tax=Natronococcus occultus SP4 TaxID=694430 RepID=L0JV18_9EURY|nr:aminoglycoside phosphotransferase family protein [Natronococcus occultus]AGB35954.1 putative homoserine kinase type II (protein kinase fold) [Natronococcus occultus SP4]
MASDAVARIVEDALGAELRASSRPDQGSVAETVVLELADEPGRAVCKRGGASVWTGDVIEPSVVARVGRETPLPVPDVLASGTLAGGPDEPTNRWALYEFLPGRNPGLEYATLEPAVRRRLVREAGELLGRLHATSSLAFDRVCGLAREDGRLRPREPTGWHAMDPGPVLDGLPVPLAGDPDCRPVLTHGDYQPSNLLVEDDGSIVGVLDWGNAHVTHAEYALARAEARFVDVHARALDRDERARLRTAFRTGYAREARLEPDATRRLRTYKLLWLAQSAANYGRIARDARGRRQLRRQWRRLLEG